MRTLSSIAFALILLVAGCQTEPAQRIVDRAIEAHGSRHLRHAVVTFDFRGRHYTVTMDGGRYRYERTYTDTTGTAIHEGMTNDSLYRSVDGQRVELTASARRSLTSSLNSVVYFALLPLQLNDPAVQKRYLGTTTIEGEPYEEVEITFRQEGGGRDWEDRYVYWFHRERHTMDYLAYRFHVDDGGTRFRKAVNPRVVGGVRFADYLNYGFDDPERLDGRIETFDDVYMRDELPFVSEIVLTDVQVRPR